MSLRPGSSDQPDCVVRLFAFIVAPQAGQLRPGSSLVRPHQGQVCAGCSAFPFMSHLFGTYFLNPCDDERTLIEYRYDPGLSYAPDSCPCRQRNRSSVAVIQYSSSPKNPYRETRPAPS